MQWIEASFRTHSQDIDALCEKLTELGADGLVIEDEADFRRFLEQNRQYWDYVDEELEARYRGVSRVKLYVEDSPEGRSQLAAFTDGTGLEPETRVVAEEDWAENWKQYYKPIEIGEKLLILPRWEPIPENPKRLLLRLDPGLAFGTGGHETTSLCMEALDERVTGGERVLDIGTGSGILAIAALKLGAAVAEGVDIDPVAVRTAGENAALNGVQDKLTVLVGDLSDKASGKYDIITANIVANAILSLAPAVPGLMAEGATFIASGIIDSRKDEVIAGLEKAGLAVVEVKEKRGWECIVCKKA